MLRKTAADDYADYSGYGAGGYNPGQDDPTQLPPQFYNPPQWDPYAWPKWALPTGLIAAGLLGWAGLKGAKGLIKHRAAMADANAAMHVAKLGHVAPIITGLGRIVRGL